MTWQRIDENTYIDDTLVTCAEYQLFIDEMREQGKYYQPDHWTSYQFPEGMARKPILGIRHSDATAFCEWLTVRELKEWGYRLPALQEASDFPNVAPTEFLNSYWVVDDSNYQFYWGKQNPVDARAIQASSFRDLDWRVAHSYPLRLDILIQQDGAIYRNRNVPLETEQIGQRIIDLLLSLESISTQIGIKKKQAPPDNPIIYHLEPAVDYTRMLLAEINRIVDRSFELVHVSVKTDPTELAHVLGLTSEYAVVVAQVIDRHHEIYAPIDRSGSLIRAGLDGATIAYELIDIFNINRELKIDTLISNLFDILFDLVTLVERIAGRSPAFEGIRLVKERK